MYIPNLAALVPNEEHRRCIERQAQLIGARTARNKLRSDYYDMAAAWKDLGVAVPPRFRGIEVASGWPQKAVDHLARRIRFEAFTLPGKDAVETYGITQLWDDNYMDIDLPQAITSMLIHSPAFIATTRGDQSQGEPDVVFSTYDALHATGEWNWAKRGLSSALLYAEEDPDAGSVIGDPSSAGDATVRALFFVDDVMYEFRRTRTGGAYTSYMNDWEVDRQTTGMDRVPVEAMLYHPRTSRRPFGGSRITRAVMYLTQAAMRTYVRMELGAEYYTNVQRYMLNVNEEDLKADGKSSWDVMIGHMLALGAADDPDSPDPIVGQFPQVSMQPHGDMLRMVATAFSGETGIPVGSLGVIQDNPSSAEAIYANKEDLVLEAEEVARMVAPAIKRSMINAVQMSQNLSEPPQELRQLGVRWVDPSTPSRAQRTDAIIKQVAGGVLPPDSEVTLEELGYDSNTIRRLVEYQRRLAARETVRAALAAQAGQTPVSPPGSVPEATGVPSQGSSAPVAPPQEQSVADYRAAQDLQG